MNEIIADQVICSDGDYSYEFYDCWYNTLSQLGNDEDGKSWWMFDDSFEKYLAAVNLGLTIKFTEAFESELNFEDTLHTYYHRDWYYLTKSKPFEYKFVNVWQ